MNNYMDIIFHLVKKYFSVWPQICICPRLVTTGWLLHTQHDAYWSQHKGVTETML